MENTIKAMSFAEIKKAIGIKGDARRVGSRCSECPGSTHMRVADRATIVYTCAHYLPIVQAVAATVGVEIGWKGLCQSGESYMAYSFYFPKTETTVR